MQSVNQSYCHRFTGSAGCISYKWRSSWWHKPRYISWSQWASLLRAFADWRRECKAERYSEMDLRRGDIRQCYVHRGEGVTWHHPWSQLEPFSRACSRVPCAEKVGRISVCGISPCVCFLFILHFVNVFIYALIDSFMHSFTYLFIVCLFIYLDVVRPDRCGAC